jgi:hypothetical protein
MSQVPQDIRKACMLLGITHEKLSKNTVIDAWKKQIIRVHPDQAGDTEAAIYINTAKDAIIHWLDHRVQMVQTWTTRECHYDQFQAPAATTIFCNFRRPDERTNKFMQAEAAS